MRIFGVNIPDEKRIDVALTYVYGIGRFSSQEVLKATKIDPAKKAKELGQEEISKIQTHIEKNFQIEGNLRQQIRRNIQLLKELGAYRGTRHAKRLPVRGQRTKTNSRTIRGNVRKTAGSGKRKVELK
ncbi:MAG: 30S ribosomal protein S13 [Anaplasmataceae bacterium]|nr:30S ribosomal protein S13 [Anaplasmataceae bacterium]